MQTNFGHTLRPAAPMAFPRLLAVSSTGMPGLMSPGASSPTGAPDPLHGPVLGGEPTGTGDVILTAFFLALFALGAFTHMSIYRANGRRGHKFIMSLNMFQFCVIRVITCVFRIAWVFSKLRGVVLFAQLVQSAGPVIIFAINLVFAQRILCAMHPAIGWHPIVRKAFLFSILSAVAVTVIGIISLSVFFFSVDNLERHEMTRKLLVFGGSWNTMISLLPLIVIFGCATPGPPAEQFGQGALITKATILVFVAALAAAGAAVRLAVALNPMGGLLGISLFDRSVFYITGFTFEMLTVAIFAHFRVDLLFHIPNGSSKQGDYAAGAKRPAKGQPWTVSELEREFAGLGIRYDRLQSRWGARGDQILLRFYPTLNSKGCQGTASSANPTSSSARTDDDDGRSIPDIYGLERDTFELGEVASQSIRC
ncbi:hypothetical protein L249_1367 [Ophiocordyceps polyrhachis-furcata BCC 54312]|uniref:Uncharacterized protein n=1 Tax=Ophiocordyceps polyrhachis-furcata BCC 54312 TaxID=1330021 RepID=A0A367KYZ7_9HYPO|nr:hypothetical protein L249_1367 [Ophiocordyceps polyrhachis-furcata BCC 54312]